MRVVSDFGLGIVDAVQVEALVAEVWQPVFAGAILNDAPSVLTFAPLTASAFRFRYSYLVNGWYFWLYEFAAYASPNGQVGLPVVATAAATAVTTFTAALHGSVQSDGGLPCQVRFQYRPQAEVVFLETPWQEGVVTAQGASAVLTRVANLQAGVGYVYRIQARNQTEIVSGQLVAFQPAAVQPGATEQWLPASDLSTLPDGAMSWVDPINAIDDDALTLATCYHPLGAVVASPLVEFTLPGLATDAVRLLAGRNAYIASVSVELQAAGSATWTLVYSGSFSDRTWLTLPLAGLGSYAKARVGFTATTTAVGTAFELGEFQVRLPPLAGIQVPRPVITPPGGAGVFPLLVTLTCADPQATIRYTTNGSDPTSASAVAAAPLQLAAPTILKAQAFRAGWLASPVAAAVFTALPPNTAPVITGNSLRHNRIGSAWVHPQRFPLSWSTNLIRSWSLPQAWRGQYQVVVRSIPTGFSLPRLQVDHFVSRRRLPARWGRLR